MKLKTRFKYKDKPARIIDVYTDPDMFVQQMLIELEDGQEVDVFPNELERMKRNIYWEAK